MSTNFNEMQTLCSNQFEAINTANASTVKALQTIATERMDYSKKSFEKARVLVEKLFGVRKFEEVIQLQSNFVICAFEDFVAEAAKIGEMYSSLAKEAFKPANVVTALQSPVAASPSNAPHTAPHN
ncbi:MAG: phasin family protein [Methylocystis sp.]